MKQVFILACIIICNVSSNLSAQCNRPNPSDNPCNASTFCNTAQLDAFCSTVPTPITNKVYMKPNGFCGSLESPSWFKFVAETATLSLRFTANGCGADGVQAVMLSATTCSDSATYTAVSTCSNPTGGQPVATITSSTLVAGQTYYLLVDGFQGAGCGYTIDVLSGTIRTTTTPLPTPSVIFGPTTVCANATNVTFSVPKVPNATDYRFVLSNGLTGDFLRTDSFYTITNFPASGTVRVCVSYKNDCTEGTATCSNVSVTTKVNVTLPTVYVCSGSTYELPDGTIIDNQTTPVATDQALGYTFDKTGGAGCDTTYNVTVVSYALREGTRSLFLKPAETVAVCNTNITGVVACGRRDQIVTCRGAAVNGCDSIVNTSIFNVNQTNTINPNNPTLNCNSFTLRAAHADTCAETVHVERYQWFYQAVANGPLSNLNNTTSSQVAATAGIYVMVVRDSVYSKTAAFTGYRILIDTIRNTVTGNGSTGALPTPTAINGRADTTVCQGATVTFRTNRVAGATSYSWSLARNSGVIVGASNDTSIVVRFNANSSGDTVFVKAKNLCDSSAVQKITVLVFNFANLDAGADRAVCGLQTSLAGTSSTSIGAWRTTSANGVNFTDATSPTTSVTASVSGVYAFIWTETSGACSKSDTVNITFNAPPQYTGLRDSCNVGRTNFFVKFNITAGTGPFTLINTATNTAVGTLATLGAFTSNALPVGTYNVQLRSANTCTSPNFSVTQACTACFTRAGTVDTTTALSICEGDSARATYLGGYVSDGNDTLQFVLHTGNPKTGIVQRSYTPRFGFRAGMAYETRYFISAIAGDDSTRQVRLNDICFDGSTGVAVVFHRRPTATISMASTSVCVGSCADLRYVFTGQSPFTVTTRITEGASVRDTTVSGRPTPYISVVCPTQNTIYRLVSVSDSFGCANTTLTQQIAVTTFTPLEAGTPRPPLSICSGTDTTVNLLTQLIGALPSGTWSETSVVRSTGTAFNAALGSFRTRNQIAGVYRFSYVVRQVNGSPCPSDTAVVTINLLASPIADAGVNDTITCDEPTITLGGQNTSTGTGITYNWSGGNAGGNARNISVQEPGTYVLRVTSPTCTSRDTVVIYIDTLSPIAIIQRPLAANTLTCKLDSIILDGSRSTPSGQIEYGWFRGVGATPQGDRATTKVIFGDIYTLTVFSLQNGCVGSDTITIYENRTPPSVVISTPPTVNCKDSVATIDASGSSRGVPYTFTWRAANGGRFLRDSTTLQPKSTTAGFYELTIRDTANGCFASNFTFVRVDTTRPIAKAAALDTIDCNNPVIGLTGRGSTLGATIGYSWIAQPGRITTGENTLNPSVDEPGTYFLTVLNTKNFCSNRDSARVIRNTERPRNVQITTKKPSCYGECDASFRIDTVSGGTKPYLYSTDGKVFTTRNVFQNQCAGTFKLYIQDAGGCQIDTTFSIDQDKQLSVSLGADTTLKLGDSLLIRVQTNADSIRNIVWMPVADSTKCPKGGLCTEQWVRPIVGTTFKATITNSTGCSATGTVRVSIDKKRPVFVPNIFAPNSGSGQNDKLMIYGSNVVKIIKRFQIYDRWGNGMFTQQNFKTDDPNFAWDGRIRGTNALPDVYIYFIEVEYLDNTTEVLEGDFTLIR